MTTRKGTYNSFLQGVSQQIPQERSDGQLGAQVNMLSDIVTGLRRRGGFKYHGTLQGIPANSFIKTFNIGGQDFILTVNPTSGQVRIFDFLTASLINTFTNAYFVATSKAAIKTTVSRDNVFILNTDKVPQKVNGAATGKNPNRYAYFSVRSSAFSKTFDFELSHPSFGTKQYSVTTSDSTASTATPEYVATQLESAINADPTVSSLINVQRSGTTVAIELISTTATGVLNADSSTGTTYVYTSGSSRVLTRAELLGSLPSILDGYIMAVGNVGNSVYYEYDNTTKKWTEVGAFETPYTISNMPYYIQYNGSTFTFTQLNMPPRPAGDEDNNPMPKFVGYGITGIGAYQSRLVLLSGSYVNMSKTTEFNQFMRTTVAELLDDDPIEVSSASLNAAQFEYAVPYNKDLMLIAQNQQAVIPANSTVLTPKTAVIYPSTEVSLSLQVEPTVISRSLYYAYQRSSDFYQIGEFIPNSYTDGQYYDQGLTDHLPLYAQGICTGMSGTTTNNMVVFSADSPQVLVNQYKWQGDERVQLAFHEWTYPYAVVQTAFIDEYLVTFMANAGNILIGIQNTQLNQLENKPVPYLDLYAFVTIVDGLGVLPDHLVGKDIVAVIYDDVAMRHSEVQATFTGTTIECAYDGVIAVGIRYESSYTLTPPFVKDQVGRVIAGANTTISKMFMEFKNTGSFNVTVEDTMGQAYAGEDTAAVTWSEVQLGYTWVNSLGSVAIPCRTRLSSTVCTVFTDGCTDLNLVSTQYLIRLDTKHRRL